MENISDALPYSYPWVVSVQMYRNKVWRHMCGGSLVGEQWVLTTARCLEPMNDTAIYRVAVGKYNLALREPLEVYMKIEDTYSHPLFYNHPKAVSFDLGLIQLKGSVNVSKEQPRNILPIEIHLINTTDGHENKLCRFASWGAAEDGYHADIQQSFAVLILSNAECADRMNVTNRRKTHTAICTVFIDDVSAVMGEPGAGLECVRDGKSMLVGVLSKVMTGEFTMPLFANLKPSLAWINNTKTSYVDIIPTPG